MDIKTIDEYILMEMTEESREVSMRAMKCATTEEYVVKKLVEMEERVYDLEDENETLKKENETLREALKNCSQKINRAAKALGVGESEGQKPVIIKINLDEKRFGDLDPDDVDLECLDDDGDDDDDDEEGNE